MQRYLAPPASKYLEEIVNGGGEALFYCSSCLVRGKRRSLPPTRYQWYSSGFHSAVSGSIAALYVPCIAYTEDFAFGVLGREHHN